MLIVLVEDADDLVVSEPYPILTVYVPKQLRVLRQLCSFPTQLLYPLLQKPFVPLQVMRTKRASFAFVIQHDLVIKRSTVANALV